MQLISRKFSADVAHRVMNERMKCFNAHGHLYFGEMIFAFDTMKEIGYQIDFKEIKRVAGAWIDDHLDHNSIFNPKDTVMINAVREVGTDPWLMSLEGSGNYCNPTVENIAREIFLAISILFEDYNDLTLQKIILYETPNCSTECTVDSIPQYQKENFNSLRYKQIKKYALEKGIVEYDDRNLKL